MAKKSEIRQICDEAISKVLKVDSSLLGCYNDRNKHTRRLKYYGVGEVTPKMIKSVQKRLNKAPQYTFKVGTRQSVWDRMRGINPRYLTIHVLAGEKR